MSTLVPSVWRERLRRVAYGIAKAWMWRGLILGYGITAIKSGASSAASFVWFLSAIVILVVAAQAEISNIRRSFCEYGSKERWCACDQIIRPCSPRLRPDTSIVAAVAPHIAPGLIPESRMIVATAF